MVYPPLDELLKHADNKYTLVTIAAKRARQIFEGNHDDGERMLKAVSISFEEIANNKITYERIKKSKSNMAEIK